MEHRLELLGPQVLVIWSEHWEELPCCVCAPWMLRRSYADRLEERKCAPRCQACLVGRLVSSHAS